MDGTLCSPCIYCDLPIKYPVDRAGWKVICPRCRRDFRLPPLELETAKTKPAAKPISEQSKRVDQSQPAVEEQAAQPPIQIRPTQQKRKPSRGIIYRYMDWCGKRSLIFQVSFVTWTTFWALLFCASIVASVKHDIEFVHDEYDKAASDAALAMSALCYLAMWSLLAIPFFIAAIATLNEPKQP
jgi:hypothetical protein